MRLSFSTLCCPEWDWETVMSRATEYGYRGIEVRGLQNELEVDKLPIFQHSTIDETSARLRDAGLYLACLDTSCDFLGGNDLSNTIQFGQATLHLAARLGTPYIRVFGDLIPSGMPEEAAIRLVAGALQQLGSLAGMLGVEVLLETHGSFANSRLSLDALELAASESVGLLWDSANTCEAGESVEYTWPRLKRYVKHVHVKDFMFKDGQSFPCLPGCGEVPLDKILRTLREDGYTGWVSFEWEKRWVPSIEAPEIALPAFVEYAKGIDARSI